eukprot:1138506-Pelagomonas_calceolata.AAC.1
MVRLRGAWHTEKEDRSNNEKESKTKAERLESQTFISKQSQRKLSLHQLVSLLIKDSHAQQLTALGTTRPNQRCTCWPQADACGKALRTPRAALFHAKLGPQSGLIGAFFL